MEKDDELSIGWQDYWIAYKKQHAIQARAEDYIERQKPIIENKTLETKYDTTTPTTITIKKEKKIIHIKL